MRSETRKISWGRKCCRQPARKLSNRLLVSSWSEEENGPSCTYSNSDYRERSNDDISVHGNLGLKLFLVGQWLVLTIQRTLRDKRHAMLSFVVLVVALVLRLRYPFDQSSVCLSWAVLIPRNMAIVRFSVGFSWL